MYNLSEKHTGNQLHFDSNADCNSRLSLYCKDMPENITPISIPNFIDIVYPYRNMIYVE